MFFNHTTPVTFYYFSLYSSAFKSLGEVQEFFFPQRTFWIFIKNLIANSCKKKKILKPQLFSQTRHSTKTESGFDRALALKSESSFPVAENRVNNSIHLRPLVAMVLNLGDMSPKGEMDLV